MNATMNTMKTTGLAALAFATALLTGCDKNKLTVRQEGNAVVLKAARAEIRVEDGRITRLTGPNGMTVNAGTSERTDRVGLGVMTSTWLMTVAHQPFLMPTIKRCNMKDVPAAAVMWRHPCEKSSFRICETPEGALLMWQGLSDGKAFYPDDELSLDFQTDENGAITMKTRGRSPKGGVFCVQTPIEDIAGENALVMPIMGGQRYKVGEMQKSVWSATSDCMRYDAPLVAIETAKGAFGMWSEDGKFQNFGAYFPKQDETASFAFEFMTIMPYETKTEAESPVVKIDAFPGKDWIGAAKPYHDWYQETFKEQIAVRDSGWGEDIDMTVVSCYDRYPLFDDHLDTLTNLFGTGILFHYFKMTTESTSCKKFDWELPGHTPDLTLVPNVREHHKRGIHCCCYMVAHCVNYNSTAFKRDHLEKIALPTINNPYGYKDYEKVPKGTPEEKWKAMKLKDTALVYCDLNSKAWREYIQDAHKKCFDALELDTIYEDCLGVIRDVGNGVTDGTSGSYGVYLHACELQKKIPVPFLGEFGPAPTAMIEKFPLVSIDAYRDEFDYLNFRMHHSLPMSSYVFGYRPWGSGNEHERSEYSRFLSAAVSDATSGLGFVSHPPWNFECGINDHMAVRAKVFAGNHLKPYYPDGRYPDGVVAMYRGKDGGIFRYTDDGKVQVMWGPDGNPLYGRVSLATEFDVPGLELPGWPMREGSRHYGLKEDNQYTLFPVKGAAANPYGKIPANEQLVYAYDTPEFTYLELAGKEPKITFKVKESKPGMTRFVQKAMGLEIPGGAMELTAGQKDGALPGTMMYWVKPEGIRTLDFVHTVKPGEAFQVITQNREWGTGLSDGVTMELYVNGIRQVGYDTAPALNPKWVYQHGKRHLYDYRMHKFTVPLDKWVGQTVLLSVRLDQKVNNYDDRQRLAMPQIIKYNGEPLDAIVPGMIPAVAWERFNGGEPVHEGDDATYPKKQETQQGVKAVGELNNGL